MREHACQWCSAPGALQLVRVEPKAGGAVQTMRLCERCLSTEGATWRLRWRVVERQAEGVS